MNPLQIQSEITAIMREFPLLAEDEEFAREALEAETNVGDFLRSAIRREREDVAAAKAKRDLAKAYQARAARDEARIEARRVLVRRLLDASGQRSWPTNIGTWTVSPKPASVDVYDLDQLPEAFVKTERKADKTALRDALKAGELVPGARMTNGGETLFLRG